MSFITTIEKDVKALWKKEAPTIEATMKEVLVAVEPLWTTALGQIAMATVSGLMGLAAVDSGAAAKAAAAGILAAAENAGVAATKASVNMLIELAVQKIQSAAPAATATTT